MFGSPHLLLLTHTLIFADPLRPRSRLPAAVHSEADGERGGAEARFQPRHRGRRVELGAAPMDAPQPEHVQNNRQQHNEEAGQE